MEARRVVKIRNSYFINLPVSVVKGLKIEKGDVLWIGDLSGDGVIVTKSKDRNKVAASVAGVDRIKIATEEGLSLLRRSAKSLERSFFNNFVLRMTGVGVEGELFSMKSRIEELEGKTVSLSKGVGGMRRFVKSKKVSK